MVSKIISVAVVITAASTLYLGVKVSVMETQFAARVDKSAALAVQQLERDLFARQAAMARAQRQAELNQRAAISRDLQSIPDVLLEGR